MLFTVLLIAGAVSVLFGLLLLLAPQYLKGVSALWDSVVFVLDEYIRPRQMITGIVLLVVGIYMFMVNLWYKTLALLVPGWIIAIFFGLLLIALPNLLQSLSAIADKKVLDTDEYVRRTSRFAGILMLVAGLYMIIVAITIR